MATNNYKFESAQEPTSGAFELLFAMKKGPFENTLNPIYSFQNFGCFSMSTFSLLSHQPINKKINCTVVSVANRYRQLL
jgi:hypothetical protein